MDRVADVAPGSGPISAASEGQQSWFGEPCMLGIDEAGRGPVLGDMVYGCAFCTLEESKELASMGFADSKKLTEAKREELFVLMAEQKIAWATDSLTATFISEQMLQAEKVSLNALAMESTCRLLSGVLQKGVNLQQVFVDTLGDSQKHQQALAARFPGISFTVCPKADSIYPIVSAASIVAKVTRDRALSAYEAAAGCSDYGSGYPSDPVTKQWLAKSVDPVFGFPPIARLSWQTCTRLLEERAVPVRWACEEDTRQGSVSGQSTISGSKVPPRHSFFRARQLVQGACF